MTVPIVLDTDIGTDIDDTWALVQVLGSRPLDLRLVTTVAGDTTYRARCASAVLAAGGRLDVPVAAGVWGRGRIEQPQRGLASFVDRTDFPDAVGALVDACLAASEPLTIVAIGPLSNLAAALEREPSIAARARVVAMCGSVHVGHRGAPGAVPEYNAACDVGATRAVLGAGWTDVLLTPLDTCGTVLLRGDRHQRVLAGTSPVVRTLLDTYREWLAANARPELLDVRSTTLYDCVAVHLAHDESLWEIEPVPLVVDDDGVMHVDAERGSTVRCALRWRHGGMDAFLDRLVTTLLY